MSAVEERESPLAAQLTRCEELCRLVREEIVAEETDPERLSRLLDELASRSQTVERLGTAGPPLGDEVIARLRRLIAEVTELAQLARLVGRRLGTRLKHISKGINTLSGYQDHTHQSVAALIDRRG